MAQKTFALLLEALKKSNKAGIGRIIIRDREDVVLLAPHKNAVVMYKLRYPYELRDIEKVPDLGDENPDEAQLNLAITLIDSLTTKFEKVDFEDRYRDALMELVDKKVSGKEIISVEESLSEEPVVDIMDALQQSIEAAKLKKSILMHLKILSWNILQGGGSRILKIINYLNKSSCQIIVLSEFQNTNKGNVIRSKLLNLGYIFQAVPLTSGSENTVLIASKLPFESKLYYQRSNYEFNYGLICAIFKSFRLIGVYLPHKKKHQLFDLLLKEINHELPLIIAGDFNTGKNYVDQKGNSFWYEDQFLQLQSEGMIDAYRHLNGDKKEYSWFSHQGNGYRYDHSLVHQHLLPVLKSCIYDQEIRIAKVSDHAPMILELG